MRQDIPAQALEVMQRRTTHHVDDHGLKTVYTDMNEVPDAAHPGIAQAKRDDFGHQQHYRGAALVYSKLNGNWKPVTDITTILDPNQFIIIRSAAEIPYEAEEREAMIEALAEIGGDFHSVPATSRDIERTVSSLESQRTANALKEKYAAELTAERARAMDIQRKQEEISAGLSILEE